MMRRAIKIGIDARMFSDNFTGIGRYNYELTKRLFHHTEIEFGGEIRPLKWVIFMNNPEFRQFNFPKHVKKVKVNAAHYSLSEQTKFLWMLRREKCDLVHFTHFNIPLGYKGDFIVTIHDTTISFFPGKKMNSPLRKWAYKKVITKAVESSKSIITVSQNTKKDVLRLFNVKPSKIQPIWISPSKEFRPSTKEEKAKVKKKFNLDSNFILYTGNWREHKNLVGLVKAFGMIKSDPTLKDWQLVITGKADPFYPEVKTTIKELNLEASVKLLGLVDFEDLVPLFGAARVYCCPSFYEGFGLPPLEAMQCMTPAVVSNVSSIPEVCRDAVLYFDPYDIKDMAQKIHKLVTEGALQKSLVKKGLDQIQNFSWHRCERETFQVYVKNIK